MQNTINIEAPQAGELNVRTGTAVKLAQPFQRNLNGIITAPANYAASRIIDPLKAIVEVDMKYKSIKLTDDQFDEFNTVVTGFVKDSDKLTQFGLNKGKQFNQEELHKLLRLNEHLLKDSTVLHTLLFELKNKSWKVVHSTDQKDDRKGTHSLNKAQEVAVPALSVEHFTITVPLYEGDDVFDVFVEILTEYPNNEAKFTLISPGLENLLEQRLIALIEKQVDKLKELIETKDKDKKLCVIYNSGV